MADTIQIRRGTTSAWNSANPVLALGEQGYDTTTKQYKVGDGTTAWTALAYSTPGHIAAGTVLANPTGSTANPVGVDAAGMRTLLEYQDYCPIINMDDYGVHPGNSAATNQTAIANLIARLKNSTSINRFHLRLNRAGTFNIQRGTTGDYVTRRSAILLPSNCTFELSKDSVLRMPLEQLAYMVRNDDPINGNKNIKLIGGQWDGNSFDGVLEETGGVGQQGFYGMVIWLENITDLRVENVVCRNPNMWAICGTKLTRAVFQSCYMDDVPRDGIHLSGACTDVSILDYAGETGDNSLAIATSASVAQNDSLYFFGNHNWADGTFIRGDMKRIRIERPHFINSNGPIVLFGRLADTIEDVYICDVTGTTSAVSAYAIGINQYPLGTNPNDPNSINPTIKNLVIERVRVTTKTNEIAVMLTGNNTKNVVVRDVDANGLGLWVTGSGYDSVKIDNVKATGVEHAIQFGDEVGSKPFFAKNVDIGNVIYTPSGGSRAGISINSNATWDNFYIDNLACAATGVSWRGITASGSTRKKIIASTLSFGPGGERCLNGPIDVRYDNLTYGSSTLEWLAADGARLIGNKINFNGEGASGVGYGSVVAQNKQVVPYYVSHTDITALGTVTTFQMPVLPRGAIITGAAIRANTAFTGGGVTALFLRVRWWDTVASAWVNIVGDTNVGAAVDTSRLTWNSAANLSHAINQKVPWELLVQSSGANINALTQGSAIIFLEFFIACPSIQ